MERREFLGKCAAGVTAIAVETTVSLQDPSPEFIVGDVAVYTDNGKWMLIGRACREGTSLRETNA